LNEWKKEVKKEVKKEGRNGGRGQDFNLFASIQLPNHQPPTSLSSSSGDPR
jgi:hypothetical protein